jgi:hypothetical protein
LATLPFPLTHVLELRSAPTDTDRLDAVRRDVQRDFEAGVVPGHASLWSGLPRPTPSSAFDPLPSSAVGDVSQSGNVYQGAGTTITGSALSRGADASAFRLGALPGSQGHSVIFALPLPPVSIEYVDTPAELLTFSQSASLLEEAGLRSTRIRVSGTLGVRHRLGTDRKGAPHYWEGQRLHAELVGFLHELWQQHAPGASGGAHELVWRDFEEGRHLRVVLSPFTTGLDEQYRTFRRYSFELRSYGTADPRPRSFVDTHFGDLRKSAQSVADAIDDATMWAKVARANLEDGVGLASDLLEPARAIDRFVGILGDVAAVLRAGKELGRQTVRAATNVRDEAVRGIEQLRATLTDPDSPALRDAVDALDQAADALELAYTAERLQAATTDERAYVVAEGDTLEGIAQRFYGTPRAWTELARVNDLLAPYISPSRLPNTAAPGDRIVLPASTEALLTVRDTVPTREAPTDERLYGVDLARTAVGWQPDALHTDVRLARGVAAVDQGLRTRVATERGANRVFPELGLPPLVGQPSAQNAAAVALAYFAEQARGDDRVAEVSAPEGELRGALLALSMNVRLRGSEQTSIPLETQVAEV